MLELEQIPQGKGSPITRWFRKLMASFGGYKRNVSSLDPTFFFFFFSPSQKEKDTSWASGLLAGFMLSFTPLGNFCVVHKLHNHTW